MALERLLLQSHHNGRLLMVAAREPSNPGEPFVLTTREGEIEITSTQLEWLCAIAGPAALHHHRQAVEDAAA